MLRALRSLESARCHGRITGGGRHRVTSIASLLAAAVAGNAAVRSGVLVFGTLRHQHSWPTRTSGYALIAERSRQFCTVTRGCGPSEPAKLEGVPRELAEVLLFWYGEEFATDPQRLNDPAYLKERTKVWYMGGQKLDAASAEFLPLLRAERANVESMRPLAKIEGRAAQTAALARVILFDQISRNAARGTPEAFQQDVLASELVEAMVEGNFSSHCSAAELLFLVQPLSHVEVPSDGSRGEMGISLLKAAAPRFSPPTAEVIHRTIRFHTDHLSVMKRFGRYPHRNSILGRETSAAEKDWLESPDCPAWAKSQRAPATSGS